MTPANHPASTWAGRDKFVATRWTVVLAAASGRSADRPREALEELARAYWFPLYAYIRRRGHSAAEAEDLTQEFFARLIEKNILAAVHPDKGRFRSFLLASARNFIANEWDKARSKKRGGDRRILPLDSPDADTRYRAEPADRLTPERLFERRWALEVLDRVLVRLRRYYADRGHDALFDALKGCLTASAPAPGYADAARRLDMTEAAVRTAAHRLRREYRRILRDEIAQTVASPDLVDEEIRFLLDSL